MPKYFTLLLLFTCVAGYSQTEADIRKHYTEVNKKITESIEKGYEGPLYQNQLVVNKNGKSWPAVGYFADTINFWYDDDPSHLPAVERNPKNVLLKVTKSTRIGADVKTSEEYLYKNSKLIFYYSYWVEENNLWETRVYFNNKGLQFKSSVKTNDKELTAKELATEEYKDFKPKPAKILADAKGYQDLFIKTM